MNKTLASLVIIAFLLCPLYTGCDPKNTELAEPLSDSSFPGSSFSVDSTTQPVAQGISGHISKDGFENVRFDADIVIPDNSTQLNIWSRNLLDINPDNVVMAFLPYFNLSYETNPTSDGGLFDAFRTEENKAVIRSWRWSFIFENEQAELHRLLFNRDSGYSQCNADSFPADIDLPFLSREEARDMAKEFLYALDLRSYIFEPVELYTLSKSRLMEELDKIIVDDPYMENILKSHGGKEAIYDAYFVFVPFQIKGVPIMSDSFGYITADIPVRGSGASFIISESGFEHISVDGYLPGDVQSPLQDAISLETAMNALDKKYDLLLLSEPVIVTKIILCYVPNATVLTPAYGFLVNQNGFSQWVYINAFTGEQII